MKAFLTALSLLLLAGLRPAQANPVSSQSAVASASPQSAASPQPPTNPRSAQSDSNSDAKHQFAPSGRLFLMPVAEVVGPYRLSVSYEGSLLKEPGILSSAGVFALGVGDLAQLEYRHTSAIGITGQSAPLPAVGVQLKLPLPKSVYLPDLAVAYRLGVPHREEDENYSVEERVTDVYAVALVRLPAHIRLHLGLRFSRAELIAESGSTERSLWLPAFGAEVPVSQRAVAVAEVGYAPQFLIDDAGQASIESGLTARLGLRWRVHPSFSLDASAGYLSSSSEAPSEVLEWDIRLGGEVFVSWGALACQSIHLFCE